MPAHEIYIYRTAAEKDIEVFVSSPFFWEIVLPCLGLILLVGLGVMFSERWKRKSRH